MTTTISPQYLTTLEHIEQDIRTWPAHLQTEAKRYVALLTTDGFALITALLPYQMRDLLPSSAEITHQLSVAHVYGWWYYRVQDDALDGTTPATDFLCAHLALLKMVDIYTQLGLTTSPCWAKFEAFNQLSAGAYWLEMQSRFSDVTHLQTEQLKVWTTGLIINRAAPFYFNTLAQGHLAGLEDDDDMQTRLLLALQGFNVARQIMDDASDWLDDLRQGQLNYVGAQLLLHFRLAYPNDAFELERLVGFQSYQHEFWVEIENTATEFIQNALKQLESYGSCQLAQLIRKQGQRNDEFWAKAKQQRANIGRLLGNPASNS